jgi:type I restriction enzyme S subunit
VRELDGFDIRFSDKTDRVDDAGLTLIQNRSKLQAGDILFSATGTIGRTALVLESPTVWNIKEGIYAITPNPNIIDARFLIHLLHSEKVSNQILAQSDGSTVSSIPMASLRKVTIPIPPLAIQQEIVKILDTFTTLGAELGAELEARKKQYEYYRDELLTFGENVEWKLLGEVGTLIRGNGLQKKDFVEEGVGCIHYGQIYTYYGTYADKTKTFVSPELAKKLKKAQKGDVLISGVSENIEDVCKPLGWLGDEICISGDMFAFRHNQNTKFITYLLQTTNFKRYKERFAHGAKVIRVKQDKILDYTIPIPPLAEQHRIVSILDKFDALVNDISIGLPAELNARRKQYEYYRNKLLTL